MGEEPRIFFGKITGDYGKDQFDNHYVKASEATWFGDLKEQDYTFIGFKGKIALWQVKSNDGATFKFDEIINDIGLNTKKFRNLKFLCINPTLVLVQRQSSKGFNQLQTFNLEIEKIKEPSYYKNENNFRKILLLTSKKDANENSDDLQLYLENNQLMLYSSKFIDQATAIKFQDYSKFKDGSHPRKDSTFNKIEKALKEKKHELRYDYLSIADLYDAFFCKYSEKTIDEENEEDIMDDYIKLLENTKNIILHGAPGTGKTYLAKKIAEEMNAEVGFVQFHPSYDYTDFVEGIRPTPDGKFKLENGIFKKFCMKALDFARKNVRFDDIYQDFLEFVNDKTFKTLEQNKPFKVTVAAENINVVPESSSTNKPITIYKKELDSLFAKDKQISKNSQNSPYIKALGKILKDKYLSAKKFVFIIDEINRGELSKIFGELFYSIDPGYRVSLPIDPQNKPITIQTQYANMVTKPNKFDTELGITDPDTVETENDKNKGNYGHFFIPDNVYIIGTMNDIDRSVESMDLAMRRRFTFKEIAAKETQDSILSKLDNTIINIDEVIKCMEALNKSIWDDETKTGELSSNYHIGAAYFLKLNNFKDEEDKFQKLWDYNLEPLLREYLRGQGDAENKLEKLETAYNKTEQKPEKQ